MKIKVTILRDFGYIEKEFNADYYDVRGDGSIVVYKKIKIIDPSSSGKSLFADYNAPIATYPVGQWIGVEILEV